LVFSQKYKNIVEDDSTQLRTVYWTALTRKGCTGRIKNCFVEESDNSTIRYTLTVLSFDRAETGACVAIQNQLVTNTQSDFGLFFANCKVLNYVACEGKGPLSQYIAENTQMAAVNLF